MNIEIKDLISLVKARHADGGIGGNNWTNHHGLERCDCDDLIEWLNELDGADNNEI